MIRVAIVIVVVSVLMFGGLPVRKAPKANASLTTTAVAWQAHGSSWESQEIRGSLTMVGLTWDDDRPMQAWYRVKRGGRWTGWFPLVVEADHGPDRDTVEGQRSKPGSDPVWVGKAEAVQFRTTGSGSRKTRAVLIDTIRSRPLLRQLSDFLTPRVPAAAGAPSQPLIRPRSDWDPTNQCVPKDEPGLVQVTQAFVHHTSTTSAANSYTQADVPGRILGICLFHTDTRDWDDIGYNFLIDKFGQIWEGRAGGIDKGVQGAHTAGFNSYSFGVAFIGYHTAVRPTLTAEAALKDLIAWKASIHNTDTSGVTTVVSKGSAKWAEGTPVALKGISGHRDAQLTACPGEACYNRLPIYRSGVAKTWKQVPLSTYISPLVGDFDGDGSDEAATFRTTDGHWLVTESDGTTSTWADFSTASGWSSQIVGDFNGDGKDDIANFHPSNGTWWVAKSTGSSFTTSLWADFSTASGWSSQIVGDFNGDGKDDIANFHPSNGTWWVAKSTGSSFTTSLWADFTTSNGWTIQIVGDFNGDGKEDIANRHVGNGTWWTSTSTGSVFATAKYWGTTPTLDHLSHFWIQDINEDGRDDVLTVDAYNGFIDRHMSSGSAFTIDTIVDTPWRTSVGAAGGFREGGTATWLYFGQEFQWIRISDLDVVIPNDLPEEEHPPEAKTTIVVTLPRP